MSQENQIDYRMLLAKYIEHVAAEEGSTFIHHLFKNKEGQFEGMSFRVEFTPEEKLALEECEKEFLDSK